MSLIKNGLWNIGGYIIPAIVTIPALGVMGRVLGAELFGVFTLALAVVGYASIFDAGLTRAVIREIAIERNNEHNKLKIISSATVVILALSLMAATLLFLGSDNVATLLKISTNLHAQVSYAFRILSFSIPFFLITQIWLSILEGEEKFAILNVYKTITGTLLSLLPAVFILYKPTLEYAIAGLVIARLLCLIIAFNLCLNEILKAKLSIDKATIKRLFMFGGWITVSNIISPILSYFDRFIVSNQLGAANVAFYTAPSEIIARLSIVPGAFARALFPRLSYASSPKEQERTKRLITLILFAISFPALLIGGVFSENIMTIWMGPSFSGTPGNVLAILLVGFLFNSLAQVPFASIQSRGFAKLTAFVHLIELIPYLLLLFYLIKQHGVIGAATAWSVRMFVDFVILIFMDKRITKQHDLSIAR